MNPIYPSPENLPGALFAIVLPFSPWGRSCFFLTAGRLSPREEALCGRPSPSQDRAPEGRIPPTLAPLIWPLPEKAIWLLPSPPSPFLLVWKLLPQGWGPASSRRNQSLDGCPLCSLPLSLLLTDQSSPLCVTQTVPGPHRGRCPPGLWRMVFPSSSSIGGSEAQRRKGLSPRPQQQWLSRAPAHPASPRQAQTGPPGSITQTF